MKSTKDYGIFKDFSSNREVDPKHVKHLVNAIRDKNLLYVNPIVVDRFMRVIDGQHRLAAAKELGVEIFYIEGEVDRKDISKLNSNQKNWKAMDYINFYTIEKVQSFVQFSHMINKYPLMSISALLILCSSENSRNLPTLKNGHLNIESMLEATGVCDFCCKLKAIHEFDFVFDSRFPLAMKAVSSADGFSFDILLDHIKSAPRSLVQCHTKKQYIEMLVEIYNRSLSKNRISVKGL